jgi:crotonobetainyl-CoA:carnitine CoA-transferase CaiB-like acyl-CoA transferase
MEKYQSIHDKNECNEATPWLKHKALPLQGIRVVEFTHMVMGPTCGMVLADLGAEVIKVEPLAGDSTRKLLGSGAPVFIRCSTATRKAWRLIMNSARGREVVLR